MVDSATLQARHGITPKQARVVVALSEPDTISKGHALIKAGYSRSVAESPGREVLNKPEVKAAILDVASQIDTASNKIMQAIVESEFGKYKPVENAMTLEKLQKTKALMTGGATENVALKISWD